MISIPIYGNGIALSWDAFNHHLYLGWAADGHRLDRDFWAAASQSYQYPYLFWPAYKLMALGVSGPIAGVVLCTINALVIPPLWGVSRHLIDGDLWIDRATRLMVVTLAITSPLAVSVLPTTSSDISSAMPLMWAIALLLPKDASRTMVFLGGALAGVSIAFKLSNAPIAVALPLLLLQSPAPWRNRVTRLALFTAAGLVGYVCAYLPWGLQLQHAYGSIYYPIHPLEML